MHGEARNTTEALELVARALRDLGTGNAATQLGALELLAKEMNDGLARLAEVFQSGLDQIARAIEEKR